VNREALLTQGWRPPEPELLALVESLTPALRETLILTAKGFTVQEIAGFAGIAPRTVDAHRERLYRILNVGSAAEAAVIAAKTNIV
jgi:DNA-binding CsgD family transcriptional regulator